MAAPRKHPPANATELTESLAAEGYSIVGIARKLGVTSGTFKRWCEEHENIQQAFEMGRETERQALHALVVRDAVQSKAANVNAFFILKARHGYRDTDSTKTKVDVEVQVSNVMVVKDFGTDQEWAEKARRQQAALIAGDSSERNKLPFATTIPEQIG